MSDNITLPREVVEGALEALDSEHPDIQLRAAIALRKALAAEPPSHDKYNELLMAVGMKHPGETRHETALRYIQQAEQQCGGPEMEDK